MESVIRFITGNIAYILLAVGILYMVFFVLGIANARKTGESFSYRPKYLISFIIIIGFAVYCLVTGQDLSTYIN